MEKQTMPAAKLTQRMIIVGRAALVLDLIGACIAVRVLIEQMEYSVWRRQYGFSDVVWIEGEMQSFVGIFLLLALSLVLLPMLIRLSRGGLPYTAQNVRTLRTTAILMGALSVLPALIEALLNMFFSMDDSLLIRMRNSLLIGIADCNGFFIGICLVLLFIREIVYYGTMLQQESDETL